MYYIYIYINVYIYNYNIYIYIYQSFLVFHYFGLRFSPQYFNIVIIKPIFLGWGYFVVASYNFRRVFAVVCNIAMQSVSSYSGTRSVVCVNVYENNVS